MRVIVCGGRDYNNKVELFQELDQFHRRHPITSLAHGAARGADTLADKWAELNNIHTIPYEADWDVGDKAGPIRNILMLRDFDPDAVIAFDGGAGTLHMVKIARKARIPVYWLPDMFGVNPH